MPPAFILSQDQTLRLICLCFYPLGSSSLPFLLFLKLTFAVQFSRISHPLLSAYLYYHFLLPLSTLFFVFLFFFSSALFFLPFFAPTRCNASLFQSFFPLSLPKTSKLWIIFKPMHLELPYKANKTKKQNGCQPILPGQHPFNLQSIRNKAY